MNSTNSKADSLPFREGDQVVLVLGTYQGTPGVFLRLKEDATWADIAQQDGITRSHPVAWLAHSTLLPQVVAN